MGTKTAWNKESRSECGHGRESALLCYAHFTPSYPPPPHHPPNPLYPYHSRLVPMHGDGALVAALFLHIACLASLTPHSTQSPPRSSDASSTTVQKRADRRLRISWKDLVIVCPDSRVDGNDTIHASRNILEYAPSLQATTLRDAPSSRNVDLRLTGTCMEHVTFYDAAPNTSRFHHTPSRCV